MGNDTGATLTEQDLHCIARLLQGPFYGTDGNDSILAGCAYCKYRCLANEEQNAHFNSVREKLTELTGVDLRPLQYGYIEPNGFPYKKFLKNAHEDVKAFFRNLFADI